jgi:hypothetical protein
MARCLDSFFEHFDALPPQIKRVFMEDAVMNYSVGPLFPIAPEQLNRALARDCVARTRASYGPEHPCIVRLTKIGEAGA